MEKTKRYKYIIALLTAFLLTVVGFFALQAPQSAKALVNYREQNYKDINIAEGNENVVFKIHCPDVRNEYGVDDYDVYKYVTQISFRASAGWQIYFVNGVPCDWEDIDYRDHDTSLCSKYYEILDYDDQNKYVYIKFKNLSELDYPEDVGFMYDHNETYVQEPQYAYVTAEPDVEDVYFVTGATSSTQSTNKLAFYLCWDENMEAELKEVRINFEMSDTTGCNIDKTLITPADFEDNDGQVRIPVTVKDPNKVVKIKATVTVELFGQSMEFTTYSSERSLLYVWKQMIADEEVVLDFEEDVLFEIKRLIAAEESGFYLKAESGAYINIYDYEQSEDWNVDLSVKNTVYRIEDVSLGTDPCVLEFRFCNNDDFYYTNIEVEHEDYENGNGISFWESELSYWEYERDYPFTTEDRDKVSITEDEITVSYWRDEKYDYFMFDFLENMTEGTELVSCNAYYANVDIALMSSDTEYTESLLAEINNWKNQYETLLASVTEKEEEIERCYQKINGLEAKISELNDTITQRNSEILSLKSDIETRKETEANLRAQIATLQSEKETLTNERDLNLLLYNKASQDVFRLEAEKDDLNAKIELLKEAQSGDVSGLVDTIEKKNSQISQLEKELEEAKKQLNKKEDKDKNTLPTFGCGSINTGSGSGAGGIASLMATVATTMILFYIGVNYARKKKQN